MVVLILEKVTPGLRGELTRWMIQPKAGVFVGRLSARVRDLLWDHVCRKTGAGAAILLYRDNTEQGFSVRTLGQTRRTMADFEGLILAKTPISE